MEQPEIHGPLKHNGRVYGSIVVRPDGTFAGRIDDVDIHVYIAMLVRMRLTDGILLTCNVVPAIPVVQSRENNA